MCFVDDLIEYATQKKFKYVHKWKVNDWVKKAEKTLPMGELVNPKKLAPLVCYLLSFSSGIITGSIINYDQQIVGAVPE